MFYGGMTRAGKRKVTQSHPGALQMVGRAYLIPINYMEAARRLEVAMPAPAYQNEPMSQQDLSVRWLPAMVKIDRQQWNRLAMK